MSGSSERSNADGAKELSRAALLVRRVGLFAGPLAFALVLALCPESYVLDGAPRAFTEAGRVTLAMMAWMAVWWTSQAVEIEATALLPLVVLPFAGVETMGEAASPYASPILFLFLGGFLIAIAMQRWGLDRRIALVTLRAVGTRPARMVGGFMLATAGLSAFVSNTATAAMMLPIGLSVSRLLRRGDESAPGARDFETSLFLGIAYAASIGGLATIVGSPPNGILVQFAGRELGIDVGFLAWVRIGLPIAALFLPLAWFLLTRVLFRVPKGELAGARELLQRELDALGTMSRGEWSTLAVFVATVGAWLARPWLARIVPGLTEPGIAVAGGLALFVLPVGARRAAFVLDGRAVREVPWGVLLLFGGGLSLADSVQQHGVADFLGAHASAAAGWPPLAIVALVTAGVLFLTELTSNTATAATLVPLLAALAPGLGLEPLELALPATLAASCAFMLPVATPPNAIVYGSGHVTMGEMCRAGLWLNLAGIAILTAASALLLPQTI